MYYGGSTYGASPYGGLTYYTAGTSAVIIDGQGTAGAAVNCQLISTQEVEFGVTVQQALRILLAVAAGKSAVNTLTPTSSQIIFRDLNDTKDVVDAVVNTDGERTSVIVDSS